MKNGSSEFRDNSESDLLVPSVDATLPRAILPALKKLGFFLRDIKNNVSIANEIWRELGYEDAQFFGDHWMQLVHPEDRPAVRSRYEAVIRGDVDGISGEFRMRAHDGSWRWIHSSVSVVSRDAQNSAAVYVGRDMDVTHRKELELQLAAAREAAERRAEEAETLRQVGIILASAMSVEDALEAVLDQARRVIPYRSAGVYMVKDEAVRLVGGSDTPGDISFDLISQDEHIGRLELCTEDDKALNDRQTELLRAFADQVAVALRASRLYDETLALAMTDSLTGLSTRRAFEHLASHRIALAKRNEAPVSVMMVDIDYFKQLNDCYGHAAGDQVLQAVGDAFRETLRKSDEGCRFGGDEFVILLPGTDSEQALLVAQRLRDSLRRLAPVTFDSLYGVAPNGGANGNDAPREVTLSVGISCKSPGEYRSIVDFLLTADQALYAAKRDGRNRVHVLEGCPDKEPAV